VIAPVEDEQVCMAGGLTGGLGSTHLDEKEPLSIEDGRMFNTYLGAGENYLGIHTKLDMKLVSGREMYLLTIVPEEGYQAAALRERILWIVGSGLFLLCMLSAAVILSGRFVNPISRSLEAIQGNALLEENFSGISEIDTLLSFLMLNEKKTEDDTLPPDIAELFDEFAKKTTELTATEKNILGYYAEGKEVAEVAELAFISIHTVRKHNLNIYRKLGVSSREELILYIDLFRRCGRLGEIL